jgi:hypothetical protein
MQKIAFCFLIYDLIHNEDIWNLFFKNIDTNKYKIYIHYKINKPLKYFEQYKVDRCIETEYCDVSIVHAQNILFKKAYDDGCDKMIGLSQSCIPFKTFNYIYDFLTKDNYGYFNVAPEEQCFPRCKTLLQHYLIDHIQKSSNWFILNRKLCDVLVHYDKHKINEQYSDIYCPEEHYFITLIFHLNLQGEIITTPNLANDATTFTNWEGMDYKYPSTRGLKNYNSISQEEIIHLLNSKCLFGRKFNKACEDSLLNKTYIHGITIGP